MNGELLRLSNHIEIKLRTMRGNNSIKRIISPTKNLRMDTNVIFVYSHSIVPGGLEVMS